MNLLHLFKFPEKIRMFQRVFSIYFILAHTGYLLSLGVNLFLCYYLHLSYTLCVGLYVVVLLTFYINAFIRKMLTGYEGYVLLRNALITNLMVALTLWLANTPIIIMWHYLDLFAIAFAE